MKKKILMFLVIFMIPLVSATLVEISTDNATWENTTSIDEINQSGYQLFLDPQTIYYMRATTDSVNWNYTSFTTNPGGFTDRMLALILGNICVAIFFGYFAIKNKGFVLKIFGYGMVMFQMLTILYVLYLNEISVSYIDILHRNLVSTTIMCGAMAVIGLIFAIIKLISMSQTDLEDEVDEKWQG